MIHHFQDVYDKLDYLSSLGKTQTAAVQRDAEIGVAEAERDAGIRVKELAAGDHVGYNKHPSFL